MERRLAAILAADVVGYSRLMGEDEAGTLEALKSRRKTIVEPSVREHGGRIVKVMGDGVLVAFRSAVKAVECAVALQRSMAEANGGVPEERHIVLRIGVNLGDVIVEGGDLYGDGVNVAARLEALADPGGICISGVVHDQVKSRLKLAYDDLGAQSLKNIAEPVRVYRVQPGTAKAAQGPLLLLPSKPSIAVLPFDNMSGDAEQAHFSDGITEDIITELSRFRSLFVIARNSSFVYRGKATEVGEIGRKLGVRYLVEGSVRKAGNRVRITAQLIDSTTGSHLWAERFDRDLADTFAVQDEVTKAIVSMVAVRLEGEELELAKRRPPQDMRAYDLWLRGKRSLDHWTREGNAAAMRLFEEAIGIDPGFARAHAGLALACLWADYYSAWNRTDRDLREAALRYARKAVALDDTDHEPHIVLAWVHHLRREYDQARRHLDRALVLNPNDADGLANRGMLLAFSGESQVGAACVEAAMRLNPNHPDWYPSYLSGCHLFRGDFDEAIRVGELAFDAVPEGAASMAAAYAHRGDMEKAAHAIQEFLRRFPEHWAGEPSARHFVALFALRSQEHAEIFYEGLRKAGMPE